MSPDAQRLAIGRALGKDATAYRFMCGKPNQRHWSPGYRSRTQAEYWQEHESHWTKAGEIQSFQDPDSLPRYLDSWDVIMPAIRALTIDHQIECWRHLWQIVHHDQFDPSSVSPQYALQCATATATQWSEAYLRTIGKWV